MTQPAMPTSAPTQVRRFRPRRLVLVALSFVILMGIFSVTVVETGQVAVATRTGSAAARVLSAPGIYLRIPFIERVWLIDTRLQVSEQLTPQPVTLANGESLQLAGWLAWRVDDPARFGELASAGTTKVEERILKILTDVITDDVRSRSAQSLLRMNATQSAMAWLTALNERLTPLGIKAERAGLRQVGLPEAATEAIYTRMSAVEARSPREMAAALADDARQVQALQARQRDLTLEKAYRSARKVRDDADAAALAAFARQYGQQAAVVQAFKTPPASNPKTTRNPAAGTQQEPSDE
jgi:membrane protease subunit HflC